MPSKNLSIFAPPLLTLSLENNIFFLCYIPYWYLIAVCLDGSVPGYHFHRGFGSGAKNWLVELEVRENLKLERHVAGIAVLQLHALQVGFNNIPLVGCTYDFVA